MTDELTMRFDPSTIEHLGIQMYSRLPNALAELVANAYDADAENVFINLYDNNDEKYIEVVDDGIGMSFEDVNEKFLRIGRHRRNFETNRTTPKGRFITGRKGLGKLALFGIGKKIKIATKTINSEQELVFKLDWNEIVDCKSSQYKPVFIIKHNSKKQSGTTVKLTSLDRQSGFDINSIEENLAKLFNFYDTNFRIYISLNNEFKIELNRNRKYDVLAKDLNLDISEISNEINEEYEYKNKLKGNIILTNKPAPASIRGITIYVNGRMANEASFFGLSDSSYVYSYLTGWVDADFLDEFEQDLISTDRQSLNWNFEETEKLKKYLLKIIRVADRKRRELKAKQKQKTSVSSSGINVENWTKTMPLELKDKVDSLLNDMIDDETITPESTVSMLKNLHNIIPEYPQYHFRSLHPEVQEAAGENYKQQKYYYAFVEAAKKYINQVAIKSKCPEDGEKLMTKVFGSDGRFSVVNKYKTKTCEIRDLVFNDIQRGQMYFSQGIVAGGRNPLSHEQTKKIEQSGVFTEQDCLDMLSLLSHLFKRLNDAEFV